MGKENRDESDKPVEAAGTSGIEAHGPPPSLIILTIDDDPGMLRFYEAALGDEDVHVTSSTDPLHVHGVELAETLRPDLILLDLTMPGIDGMEALRRICLHDPERRAVMITGDYSIESAVKAIQAGATDYVCKPITPEKVRRIIQG